MVFNFAKVVENFGKAFSAHGYQAVRTKRCVKIEGHFCRRKQGYVLRRKWANWHDQKQ